MNFDLMFETSVQRYSFNIIKMFVLKYKSNESSPSVKDQSYNRDIISDDIESLQHEVRHASKSVRTTLFPFDELKTFAHVPEETTSLDMCKHELKSMFRDIVGHPVENPTFANVIEYTPSSRDDIIHLSDINSPQQLISLSNISSHFGTIYLVKPRLMHPLNEDVYVFLVREGSTPSPTTSKLIYKLSEIIDFGLCVYSYMSYCVNLGMSISEENEFHTNFVKLPKIDLPADEEYKFYIESLFTYALDLYSSANEN